MSRVRAVVFPRKTSNRLLFAIFPNLEVFGFEVANVVSMFVGHHRVHQHDATLDLDGSHTVAGGRRRLLRVCPRQPYRESTRDNQELARAYPPLFHDTAPLTESRPLRFLRTSVVAPYPAPPLESCSARALHRSWFAG